jgi:hypothetical protein
MYEKATTISVAVIIAASILSIGLASTTNAYATSEGRENALEDRGEEGVTDTGLCEADQQVHDNTGGFQSDQDNAFHKGTTQGGFPVGNGEEGSFTGECPHLGGGN